MPLNDLVINGLKHETSHSENNKTISLSQKSGEIILFFEIDNDMCKTKNRILEFKQNELSYIIDKGAVCDLLIVYSKQNLECKLFLLVELKGDTEEQVRKAIRQIIVTYKHLECELKHRLDKNSYSKIKWIGLILSGGCSPNRFKQPLKEESKKFGYSTPPIPILLISEQKADDKVVRRNVNGYRSNLM